MRITVIHGILTALVGLAVLLNISRTNRDDDGEVEVLPGRVILLSERFWSPFGYVETVRTVAVDSTLLLLLNKQTEAVWNWSTFGHTSIKLVNWWENEHEKLNPIALQKFVSCLLSKPRREEFVVSLAYGNVSDFFDSSDLC